MERFRDFFTIHLVFAARRQMNIMTLPPGPEPKGMELLIGFVMTLPPGASGPLRTSPPEAWAAAP